MRFRSFLLSIAASSMLSLTVHATSLGPVVAYQDTGFTGLTYDAGARVLRGEGIGGEWVWNFPGNQDYPDFPAFVSSGRWAYETLIDQNGAPQSAFIGISGSVWSEGINDRVLLYSGRGTSGRFDGLLHVTLAFNDNAFVNPVMPQWGTITEFEQTIAIENFSGPVLSRETLFSYDWYGISFGARLHSFVPEPGTLSLVGFGLLSLGLGRRAKAQLTR